MQRSTRIAFAMGLTLILGALAFILVGGGIEYLSGLIGESSGYGLGVSLVSTGYAIIAVVVIAFILVVGFLVYHATHR